VEREENVMAQVYQSRTTDRRGGVSDSRAGFPLWAWPLIPLVLGLLALGMSLRDTPRDTTAAPQVTDMLSVVNQQDQSGFVGQSALFTNVTVQSVVGDRAFWIGPDASHQMLVVLDDAASGKGNDALTQIRPGQRVTLGGTIEEFPGVDKAQKDWGIPAGNTPALTAQQVFMHAHDLRIDG